MVRPDVKISIKLPSRVIVYIWEESVRSKVRGFTIPGIVNWYVFVVALGATLKPLLIVIVLVTAFITHVGVVGNPTNPLH